MNSIQESWNKRSTRERNAISLLFLTFLLVILINLISSAISASRLATKQYTVAKNDYQYVESGAKQLLYQSKANDINGNQGLLKATLNDMAIENEISLDQINITGSLITTSFSATKIEQIIGFIESVANNIGLGVKSATIETNSQYKLTTIVFKLKNHDE